MIAWIWLEQFLAAGDRADDFYAGKRQAATFFFRYELPKTAPQLEAPARSTSRDSSSGAAHPYMTTPNSRP